LLVNPNRPPNDQSLKHIIFHAEAAMRLSVAIFSALILIGVPPDFAYREKGNLDSAPASRRRSLKHPSMACSIC
jgi:hypothetical protein